MYQQSTAIHHSFHSSAAHCITMRKNHRKIDRNNTSRYDLHVITWKSFIWMTTWISMYYLMIHMGPIEFIYSTMPIRNQFTCGEWYWWAVRQFCLTFSNTFSQWHLITMQNINQQHRHNASQQSKLFGIVEYTYKSKWILMWKSTELSMNIHFCKLQTANCIHRLLNVNCESTIVHHLHNNAYIFDLWANIYIHPFHTLEFV